MFDIFSSKKRGRDEDDAGNDGIQHLEKKFRTTSSPLPLQDVQTATMWAPQSPPPCSFPFQKSLTPSFSDSGDSVNSPAPSTPQSMQEDVEMEGVDNDCNNDRMHFPDLQAAPAAINTSTPHFPKSHLKLSPTLQQEVFPKERMPTPIYSTFGGHPMRPGLPSYHTAPGPDAFTPRTTQIPPFLDTSSRIPSPISEDGFGSPAMITASTQLSRLSFSCNADDTDDNMQMDSTPDTTPETPTTPPFLAKKGRARSGAITGTEKRRIVFGFRSECDKCQAQVPGHVAHFVT